MITNARQAKSDMSEAESEATAHSIQCKQKEQANRRICHNGKDKIKDWVTSQLKIKTNLFHSLFFDIDFGMLHNCNNAALFQCPTISSSEREIQVSISLMHRET